MTKVINIDDHKKRDGSSKYDLKDVHDNTLRFNLNTCNHCSGTIVYTREREVNHPFGTVQVEEMVVALCVKATWYRPWEFFMAEKSLFLSRLARIRKDINWANQKYQKTKSLKDQLEA